jgi:hypothetical protein
MSFRYQREKTRAMVRAISPYTVISNPSSNEPTTAADTVLRAWVRASSEGSGDSDECFEYESSEAVADKVKILRFGRG